MKHPAAPLLAQDFGRLQHTNDRGEVGYLHMPGFVPSGMSAEQAEETLGPLATGLSEGIIETLRERHGYHVIHQSELEATARELAPEPGALKDVPIHCNRCRGVVIDRLHISGFVKINVQQVAEALQAHVAECRQ